MSVFLLPDLGEGLAEAEIVHWQVSEGDHIIADQPMVSLETEKAVVEVPAPYSGSVKVLLAKAGDIVATGAPLIEIETEEITDSGAIVGELADNATVDSKRKKPVHPRPRQTAAEMVKASPAVRSLAREKGVDLASVRGTGPQGLIVSSDVLSAVNALPDGTELRGVRRAMARAMTHAGQLVVPATITDRANIDGWVSGQDPTLRLVQATVEACKNEPSLNVWFDGHRRQIHDHVDLGLAVDTPNGLIVPVLRNVDASKDVSKQIAQATRSALNRTATPAELQGATITLSNFGMLGGEFASLVVLPPQVAIVGSGRISDICMAAQGKPRIQRVIPLSLTFDHRAVTGAEAARFLSAVCTELGKPEIEERKN